MPASSPTSRSCSTRPALVFHYAQEIFEGLKAYKWADGRIALFRPEMNARRFNQSAERLCMPEVPEELFLEGDRAAGRPWSGTGFPTAPGHLALHPPDHDRR